MNYLVRSVFNCKIKDKINIKDLMEKCKHLFFLKILETMRVDSSLHPSDSVLDNVTV